MKLKYRFDAVHMGDEIISVPVGDGAVRVHGVIRLYNAGFEIMELLKNDITADGIVRVLASKYDNGREELAGYVSRAVLALKNAGLIEES